MTTGADWDRVKQLFHEALDTSPDARLAFVEARASDAQVFQEVMSLLQAYPSAEGFLSTPADPVQVGAVLARLDSGDQLGPFRITGLIGAGGMGEVYRAWDTRLDRPVAIKVVPQALSIDGAARERFEAEARAISRLTHPRISTLYDVGSASIGSATVQYLVMELVDGETLAARLRRGALPVDEALAIAIDIAEALAAAHAAGVVHRDVKPANIMLTRSGAKLLDFGLARLRPSPLAAASARPNAGDPATQRTGLLGTLPYMAPELLRGAGTDARTDLFAFGAVLYEMLTGSAAFAGESEADLVVAILEREPTPIATRQPLTPPTLARLVATCLAKDLQDRWQTSHDLVRALQWIRDDRSRPAPSAPTTSVVSRRVLAWVGVAAAVLIGALAIAAWKRPIVNPSRVTFSVFATAGTQFPRGTAELAVAPDGSGLVFVAIASTGTRQLWLRRFDLADNQLLAGTDDAASPFWSPDARWIAFVARGKLWKIAPTGGQPQVVCDAQPYAHGTWNHDGTILFSGYSQSISRVSENGGMPGHGPRSVARRFRPLVSRVPARRTAVRVPRGQKTRRCLGAVSGLTRFDRDPAGGRFGSQRGGRWPVSDVVEQGRPGRAALRPESGRARRLADRDRRSHCLGPPTPLGEPLLGGSRRRRDRIPERQSEQPPPLVRSHGTPARFVPRSRGLASSAAVSR
jgi:serine/threonine protein kinase